MDVEQRRGNNSVEVAGANAGWRWPFRFAVHGFWSGVAQLFSLGHFERYEYWFDDYYCCADASDHAVDGTPLPLSDYS